MGWDSVRRNILNRSTCAPRARVLVWRKLLRLPTKGSFPGAAERGNAEFADRRRAEERLEALRREQEATALEAQVP